MNNIRLFSILLRKKRVRTYKNYTDITISDIEQCVNKVVGYYNKSCDAKITIIGKIQPETSHEEYKIIDEETKEEINFMICVDTFIDLNLSCDINEKDIFKYTHQMTIIMI